ncbi:hypothetical protein EOD42_05710 [Rhodovarius crocodyli]|uniref:DUF4410 domain-containing protein n=1 Tax=Rhodovarius crocodyli TaxID=1979269 RepID=A0A437MPL4_9PROT|nr:hypothetical protein [Rhodovarius crocodyli]RVT99576.1 hypothetical protein EOD42_05710 [Rhodovarius crocodyli]
MRVVLLSVALAMSLAACQTDSRQQVLATSHTQVAQRAISTRAFDTSDRNAVFRAVLSTLQDLGFVIDRADDALGTVTATRAAGTIVRFTVIVREAGDRRTIVRASGQHNLEALTDPLPFQRFYDALSQSLFLAANNVE